MSAFSEVSEASWEFVTRVTEGCERGDSVELEGGEDREPLTLIENPDTPSADARLLLMRLEDLGYEVGLEYEGEKQKAYTIQHPGYGGDGE